MNGFVGTVRRFSTGGMRLGELASRVWTQINKDQVGNKAAELAYFFTLAFFPLLIFLITLLSLIPGAPSLVLNYLDSVLPQEAAGIIHGWVKTIFSHGTGTILSVSLLFALWSASTGVAALIDVFNVAYEIREERPYWRYRLVALALTVGIALLVLGGTILFTFGSLILVWLGEKLGLSALTVSLSRVVNDLVGLGMLYIGVSVLHYFGPDAHERWKFFTPGAILTVIGILLFSHLFSLYLQYAPSYDAVYGGLGAIIIFMLWQYFIGFILIIGAEVNGEIQKAMGHRLKKATGG